MPRISFRTFTIEFLITLLLPSIFTQQCRSYNKQIGNCVSIKYCPPLLYVLKNSPTAVQLRHLQRLTCGFANGDPKVCCPLNVITNPGKPESTQTLRSHPGFAQLPNITECGTAIGQDRIIGGKNAALGSYPWIARIGYKTGPNSEKLEYYCGGSLIGKRWILTAAHCTDGLEEDFSPNQVRLGEYDTESVLDCDEDLGECSSIVDYKIKKLIPHEEYSSNTKQNDISLIELSEDVKFNKLFIKPICLPFVEEYNIPKFEKEKTDGIVVGWGRTQWNKATGSSILQEVSIPLKTNEECQSVYRRRVTISTKQFCAGGVAGQDSCGGDSGGPLIVSQFVDQVPRFFQLGVVSYGPVQCGIGGLPGVYASTSAYLKWILDNISKNT